MNHTSDQAPNATSLHLKEEFSRRAFEASKLRLGFVEFFAPVNLWLQIQFNANAAPLLHLLNGEILLPKYRS